MLRPLPLTYLSDQALWVSNAESNKSSIEANKSSEMRIAAQITNRPFYRCALNRLIFEWKWGWSWPCFDENSRLFLFKFMRTASFTYDTEETILEASWNWSIQKKPSVESDLNWKPVHIQMFVRRVTDIMVFAPTPARFLKDILSQMVTHQDINLIIQGKVTLH